MNDLASHLRSGELLLMDGAMGTELQRRCRMPHLVDLAACNHTEPAIVHEIHADYLIAGAQVLLTNTFQANPETLPPDQLRSTWESALALARNHTQPHFVLADVGPVREVTDAFMGMLRSVSSHVDGILLETWSSATALLQVAERLEVGTPLLISFTFRQMGDLKTFAGDSPEVCAGAASAAGALAVGVNCGCDIGFAETIEIVQRYRKVCDLPIFARPNAGTPIRGKDGWEYEMSAAQFACGIQSLIEAGVVMIGGCCGTKPTHIRAIYDEMLK